MQENDAVLALAALAQAMRLRVFRELVVAGPAGLTPGVLSERMEVAGATLSFHLKELLRADLVTQERASRNLIYRANFARVNELLGYMTEHCCQGDPCGTEAAGCEASSCAPAPARKPARTTTPRSTRHEAIPRSRPRR
jgi:DNA-binding transcriptional ArsR family regulator